jgi:hypothetical protein
MKNLLEKAGASFLRAFGASIITYAPGILAAPDLNGATVLATAALASSLTAGLKAIQVLVPQFTFGKLLGTVPGAYADSFARAFLGTFLTLAPGIYAAPNLDNAKAAAVAAVVGALAAGARAVQSLFTKGESIAPGFGI